MKNSKLSRNCGFCKAKEGELHKNDCKRTNKIGKPHFHRTHFCNRCRKEIPRIFMVPDKEWQRVVLYYYTDSDILCKRCFNYVKKTKEKWKKKGINMFKTGLNKKFFKKSKKKNE